MDLIDQECCSFTYASFDHENYARTLRKKLRVGPVAANVSHFPYK